jgi:WD40 repeat protein
MVVLMIGSVIDGATYEDFYDVKAHGGEIMDIAIHKDTIVSCARDRTVQIFVKAGGAWTLSQTLDDHTASVQRVLLLEDGKKLLSCSTDRTIVIRELCHKPGIDGTVTDAAYVPYRTLNTKASPVHMAPLSDSASTLLVSTLDRQIIKYDLASTKILSSFKVTDETGDAVVMDAITLSEDKSKPRVVVGTSTTDKSIRLYDMNGGLVDKEWGHTEGVSDVCLLEFTDKDREEGMTVISTGTDGTIMIWEFAERGALDTNAPPANGDAELSLVPKDLTATRMPLRRVLSKSELMVFTPKGSPTAEAFASGSKSVGSTSPPRVLRKKTSMYGMNRPLTAVSKAGIAIQQQTQSQPSQTSQNRSSASSSEDSSVSSFPTPTAATANRRESNKSTRGRTPSPPDAQTRLAAPRRASYDARSRQKSRSRKSDASINTINSINSINGINGLAESLTRSLRSFRKKVEATDDSGVRPEVLRALQRELGLTVKELGGGDSKSTEKDADSSSGEDDMMAIMLDEYSSKLLSLVKDRLEEQFQRKEEEEALVVPPKPRKSPAPSNNGDCGLDRRKGRSVEVTGEG